jgi:hypothetical protein
VIQYAPAINTASATAPIPIVAGETRLHRRRHPAHRPQFAGCEIGLERAEVVAQILRGLVPILRILRQAALDDARDIARQLLLQVGDRLGRVFDDG